jgi:hypothetical protein
VTKLSILKSDRDTDKEGKINLATSAWNINLYALLTNRVTQAQCNVCYYFCVVAHSVTVLSAASYSHFRGSFHYNYNRVNYYCSPILCFLLLWSTGRDGSESVGLCGRKRIIHSIMSC